MTTDERDIWEALNECECVKKVKGHYWLVGDRCVNLFSQANDIYTIGHSISVDDLDSIWIPPLYDPINPERSLIGIAMSQGCLVDLHQNVDTEDGVWRCRMLSPQHDEFINIYSDRPDLALAKAIIEQENI